MSQKQNRTMKLSKMTWSHSVTT